MTDEIMRIPLLANHCVLEGFEDLTKRDSYQKMFGDEITRLLPAFEETEIVVLNKLPNTSTYVVKIPSIDKSINPNILIIREKETNTGDADLTKECDAEVVKICSNISKEVTSVQSKKELHEKLYKRTRVPTELWYILYETHPRAFSRTDTFVACLRG